MMAMHASKRYGNKHFFDGKVAHLYLSEFLKLHFYKKGLTTVAYLKWKVFA